MTGSSNWLCSSGPSKLVVFKSGPRVWPDPAFRLARGRRARRAAGGQAHHEDDAANLRDRRRRSAARAGARGPCRHRGRRERGARGRPDFGRLARRAADNLWRAADRAASPRLSRSPSALEDRSHDVGSLRKSDRRRRRARAPGRRAAGLELRRAQTREREASLRRRPVLSRAAGRAGKPRRPC